MDVLSEVFAAVRVSGGVFLDAEFTAPWCVVSQVGPEDFAAQGRLPAHLIAYHYVIDGRLLVRVGDDAPLPVLAGEIVLLPLGGVALMSRNPSKPLHELLIAAAGPLVNLAIAVVLFALAGAANPLDVLNGQGLVGGQLPAPSFQLMLAWLLAANISLVLFNLIPAFPLDGGRMLRAVLAMFMHYQRATRIATIIGQVIAIGLGVYGFLSGNILLALVALFVFVGAGQENAEGQARTVLETRRVGDAYNKHALTLQIGERVSSVANYILTSYQPDFAVMQAGQPIGIVTRNDVLHALATDTADGYVTGIMQREIVRVEASASLESVRELMNAQGARVVAVYDGSSYLGLVSLEDIAEAFMVITFQQRQLQLRSSGQAGG